jgi:glycosyltransferase involved in cell wall biosynthesis
LPPYPKRIVTIGRLCHQKGFDRLIEIFAKLADHYPDWELVIAGEGPDREKLEALIAELQMTGRVTLCGAVEDTLSFLRAADIFVMPSRYEGFPNALCEARACNKPVIATNCSSSIPEILAHEDVCEVFSLDRILDVWEQLL